jgi:hypothetical protein
MYSTDLLPCNTSQYELFPEWNDGSIEIVRDTNGSVINATCRDPRRLSRPGMVRDYLTVSDWGHTSGIAQRRRALANNFEFGHQLRYENPYLTKICTFPEPTAVYRSRLEHSNQKESFINDREDHPLNLFENYPYHIDPKAVDIALICQAQTPTVWKGSMFSLP